MDSITVLLAFVPRLFRAHASRCLENLALRHQLAWQAFLKNHVKDVVALDCLRSRP